MFALPRIVFFGTPVFAVASLDRLVDAGYPVVAVVTAPDKPSGRGLKKNASPVKQSALSHGIPVLQPTNLKDAEFLQQLKGFRPDIQIVIAFRMLPQAVWSLPPLGTFNLHASLLPQYRGAAPINHAIMNGESMTGVTTFYINERIDTGSILLAERVTIAPDETAGELHDRLMTAGAILALRTVAGVVDGTITETPQEVLVTDPASLHAAPKIFREDCRINWKREAKSVHDFIRGLSPVPGAFTDLRKKDGTSYNLKILRAFPEHSDDAGTPGEFITDGKSSLKVKVADGFIHLAGVQLSGRKPMSCGDFLRGFGWIFSETHGI